MTMRGRKPTPAYLKVTSGNPGKRPFSPDLAVTGSVDGGIDPPQPLDGRHEQLWNQYIRPAHWLTPFDAPKAFMWVSLTIEFEQAPDAMIAGKIAQLRA